MSIQYIWKVSHYVPKNSRSVEILSKYLKIIYFRPQTLEKYFYATHCENLIFAYKIFEKLGILIRNCRKVFRLDPKYSTNIWFGSKTFEDISSRSKVFNSIDFQRKIFDKCRSCAQNIRGRNIRFLRKTFQKFQISTQIIWNVRCKTLVKILNLYSMQNIRKVFDFDPKHLKSIEYGL